MRYQITMSSGEKYFIAETEAVNIAKGEMKGLVLVPTIKGYINLSFVQSVIPEDKIDRSKMNKGRLHDGTLVVKKFGEWKDAHNPKLELDYNYYPELGTDEVMSESEYDLFEEKKIELLKTPTETILNCPLCKGTGYGNYNGPYMSSPFHKLCSCVKKEIKGTDLV